LVFWRLRRASITSALSLDEGTVDDPTGLQVTPDGEGLRVEVGDDGIASADAACCAALGRRSRSEDHREAAALLREIVPDGARAAKALVELLNLKDTAQYGLIPITPRELTTTRRRARTLLDFAADVLRK